jgi:hypothetical protein
MLRGVHVDRLDPEGLGQNVDAAAAEVALPGPDLQAPWVGVVADLLQPANRLAMSQGVHTGSVVRMMSFAQRAFAYSYTAGEAGDPERGNVREAIERLPEGDRAEGWARFNEFLEVWGELRPTLVKYDMCPNEERALGDAGAAIEPLAIDDTKPGTVAVLVAHLAGLVGEELVPCNPIPRMLEQRLLKDHNRFVSSETSSELVRDPCFNLFGALGDDESRCEVAPSDVPWTDDAAVRGLLVTGAYGVEGWGEGAMVQEIDNVTGMFARWVSVCKDAEAAAIAARRTANEAALQGMVEADRIRQFRQRMIGK